MQVEKNKHALESGAVGAPTTGLPTPTSQWRADHVILGRWHGSDANEERTAMAGRLLKILGSKFSELYMVPSTPRKYNCSSVKCKARDEQSASRLAFALGIRLRDSRPELAAVIGGRKICASVERSPHVGAELCVT